MAWNQYPLLYCHGCSLIKNYLSSAAARVLGVRISLGFPFCGTLGMCAVLLECMTAVKAIHSTSTQILA